MNDQEKQMIVVNEETGENFIMECGDDLDPLEQSDEYIDYDNPIQFTDDQMSYNLVNILSYNDKNVLKNKELWFRRAREFIQLSKTIQSYQCLNTKLFPIIKANKQVIVDNDTYNEIENDRDLEQEYAESFLDVTKLEDVLQRRMLLSKTQESYTTYTSKAIFAERIWIDSDNKYETNFATRISIEKDTCGYIGLVDVLRPVKLFGKSSCGYTGDIVNVLGFVFTVHDSTHNLCKFNTNKYINDLSLLQNGDHVKVVYNTSSRIENGIVKNVSAFEIDIEQSDQTILKIFKGVKVYLNDVFVYHHSKEENELFSKYIFKHSNVLFTLLDGDIMLEKTFQMILPSMKEVLTLYDSDEFCSIHDISCILEKFGFSLDRLTEDALSEIRHKMTNNTLKQISKSSTTGVRKKVYRKEFSSTYSVLNFDKHSSKFSTYEHGYMFKNNFNDTDYHRISYVFSEGDAGLLYNTQLLSEDVENIFLFVQKNKQHIENELQSVEKAQNDLQSILKKMDCKSFIPQVKKTYKDINVLEKDNFKVIEGVIPGDFAELITNNTKILYQRHRIENNKEQQEFWVKHKEYKTCNESNNIPNHQEFLTQKCTYDDRTTLCSTKEYYVAMNKSEQLNKRKTILKRLESLYKKYDIVKHNLTTDIELMKQSISIPRQKSQHVSGIVYEDKVDYTDFVGNPEEDDEDRMGKAEQGEGIVYKIMKPDENEDEPNGLSSWLKMRTQEDNKNTKKTLVESLVNQLGIELDDDETKYILRNQEYYYNENKLHNDIVLMKKKLIDSTAAVIKKDISNNPKLIKAITDKRNKERDVKISSNTQILKRAYNKNVVSFISAMFIILVQMKLPNIIIKTAYPSCMKQFGLQGPPLNKSEKSLVKYISCVIKEISIPKDEVFDVFTNMTIEQIQQALLEQINKIISDKQDILHKLEETELGINVPKIKITHEYGEWIGYRPCLHLDHIKNNNTSDVVKYITMIMEMSRTQDSILQLAPDSTFISSFMKNENFNNLFKVLNVKNEFDNKKGFGYYQLNKKRQIDDLFTSKPIELKTIEKIVKMRSEEHTPQINNATLKEAIQDKINDDIFWDAFPNRIEELFVNYWSKFNMSQDLKDDVSRLLLSIDETKALKIKNALKCIVFDDIKTQLGKLIHNWTVDEIWLKMLPQLDKSKREYEKVKDIMISCNSKIYDIAEKIKIDSSFLADLQSIIISLTGDILNDSGIYNIKTTNPVDIKKNIYVYDYILLTVLYSMLQKILPNEGDMFDIDHVPKVENIDDPILKNRLKTVFEIGEFLISTTINKIKRNIFDTKDIMRKNELLREGRKNDTISRLDKLTTEERKMTLELQKLQIISWADIPEHVGDEAMNDLNDNKVNKHEREEDMYDLMNEQEEQENFSVIFKGRDGDENGNDNEDDDNDVWLNED